MNPQIEQEIKSKIEANYKLIVGNFGNDPYMTRPYISSAVINVTQELVRKYGVELKMNYDSFLKIVEPIAEKLLQQYFGK